jgi:hypothetical protein
MNGAVGVRKCRRHQDAARWRGGLGRLLGHHRGIGEDTKQLPAAGRLRPCILPDL